MRDLETFHHKVKSYCKQRANIDGKSYTQTELAREVGLNKDELSKRLKGYKDSKTGRSWVLSPEDVLAIVQTLAKWEAISTQRQAEELLMLMDYSYIQTINWSVEPFNCLQPISQKPASVATFSASTHYQEERLIRLKAMQIDHIPFLHDRLESFVGRLTQLAELHDHISMLMLTGGYLTVTGEAGQGKSSIIAKLANEYGTEKSVHHFIPLIAGPDYQVSLLRDLMAQLILKHGLSDLYIASESRVVLRDYFPKVLRDIADAGKQEVIFIDGLDQLLMDDSHGERDLSFLPSEPPKGIVFVLGTRPDDTLQPLELRRPHRVYRLPDLGRKDFDLILEHRGIKLSAFLIDQFYQAMQGNALYLDLVAKELAQTDAASPEAIIQRVADNPDNLFSISMARLKRNKQEWYALLKPIWVFFS